MVNGIINTNINGTRHSKIWLVYISVGIKTKYILSRENKKALSPIYYKKHF